MADLEQSLEELDGVKQSFKANINNAGISTSNVEFRNMPNLINQMEKKLPSQVKEVTPTKERQVVNPDEGFKMTGTVVNPIPDEYIVPTGVKSITENGTYDVSDFATAQVDVAGESATLVTKEITENGTYTATDDNADGYSSVTVNVASSEGGSEEVIVEKYTDITALKNKAIELVTENRYCHLKIIGKKSYDVTSSHTTFNTSKNFVTTDATYTLVGANNTYYLYPTTYNSSVPYVVFENKSYACRLNNAPGLYYSAMFINSYVGIGEQNVSGSLDTLISGGYIEIELCYI